MATRARPCRSIVEMMPVIVAIQSEDFLAVLRRRANLLNVGRVVPVVSRLDWNAQQVFEDVDPADVGEIRLCVPVAGEHDSAYFNIAALSDPENLRVIGIPSSDDVSRTHVIDEERSHVGASCRFDQDGVGGTICLYPHARIAAGGDQMSLMSSANSSAVSCHYAEPTGSHLESSFPAPSASICIRQGY